MELVKGSWGKCVSLEQRHRLTSREVLALHAYLSFSVFFLFKHEEEREKINQTTSSHQRPLREA